MINFLGKDGMLNLPTLIDNDVTSNFDHRWEAGHLRSVLLYWDWFRVEGSIGSITNSTSPTDCLYLDVRKLSQA